VFSNPANGTWSYTYDGASRLTQATGPNATGAASTVYDYAYDGGGNRILAKETTGSVVKNLTTTYDAAGLPTSATDAATGESVTYTHDAIGNLTGIDSSVATNDWTYAFDAYSRTTCAVQGSTCASGSTRVLFSLDALDRATTRTKGSATTSLTYRGIGESLAKTVNGATTTMYASTPTGAPLAEKTSSISSFYLRDPHGDVVGLASTTATNQGTASFDPWGRGLATTGQTAFLGYQGDMTDPDSKQVDMGTRWYAAGLGRFTSRDVIFGGLTAPMTLNQHVYGGSNPVSMWDPTGMGQCTMAGECQTTTSSGDVKAVGGNPGTSNNPYHDQGSSVTTTPRQPAPDPLPPNLVKNGGFSSASVATKIAGGVITGLTGAVGGTASYASSLREAAYKFRGNDIRSIPRMTRAEALESTLRGRLGRGMSGRVLRGGGYALAGIGTIVRYNQLRAEGRGRAESAAIAGGGLAGGLALGTLGLEAGLACGPVAWICSPVLGIGGGIAGSILGEDAVDSIINPEPGCPYSTDPEMGCYHTTDID
jgi:RHS repeat-associated protein